MQNRLGWERPVRLSPANDQTSPCHLDHGIQCHVHSFLNDLYPPPPWAAHRPFCAEIPHDVQSESALAHTEAMSAHPVAGCQGEKKRDSPPGYNLHGEL